jgi:colicin import membrane protein
MRDYGLPVSIALHVLVLGGALIALPSAEPFAPAEESLPIEIITPEEYSAITKGEKTAKPADKPEIKVDEVAEAKLEDDPAEEVKRESVTAPPPPQPKAPDPVVEPPKPAAAPEPAPEPPKPEPVKTPTPPSPPPPRPQIAEAEAKPAPKETQKLDELALKALEEEEKPTPEKPKAEPPKPDKRKAETPPEPQKAESKPAEEKRSTKQAAAKASTASDQPERKFDTSKIAALLSKEAPARAKRSDREASQTASLGSARGNAPKLSLSQRSAIVGAIMNHVSPCWSPPSFAADAKDLGVLIAVDLNADGTLATDPEIIKYPASSSGSAAASAAMRAIKRCVTAQSPLKLPPNLYASWREIEINFDPSQMAGG